MNAGADDTNTEQPNHATDTNNSNETHQDHHKRDRGHHSHDQDKIKSGQKFNKNKVPESRPVRRPHPIRHTTTTPGPTQE